ncbi:MAG: heparinase II/III family protein [Thermoguttaceae bacterium]|nr:heparinase II/III family protein [Thermoguttaceae bacterium]
MTISRRLYTATRLRRFFTTFLTFLIASASLVLAEGQETYPHTPAREGFTQVERDQIVRGCASLPDRPRLLLTSEAVDGARERIANDECWRFYYDSLVNRADRQLGAKPVERVLEGVRLLMVSQEALGRIFRWSFLYRYTGDRRYAERVEREALAAADFDDWNPTHFLDVAEMTTALAIAYDSCYDALSDQARERIRDAIWEKGVLQTLKLKNGWWKKNNANWNQVCWCGTLYGALAIVDDLDAERRELAIDAILDAVNGVTWSMASYAPDGNYTEGPGYWAYGTSFNTLLLEALTNSFGTDFGRSDAPGFLQTIDYFEHVFGTTGAAFNYPDSTGGHFFEATAFWFARKLNKPELMWNERFALISALKIARDDDDVRPDSLPMDHLCSYRLGVCALLWGVDVGADLSKLTSPNSVGYVGIGDKRCCVALFRTTWDAAGAYLGVKCGAPNSPHGHMDEGGFVYDDRGVRWVLELGPENYNQIESRGMNLWSEEQDSDRWKILRYNNYGHSVPTVNGAMQRVDGTTSFVETKIGASGEPSTAVIDLTPVYRDELESAMRTATLYPDGSLVIEDVFTAKEEKAATIERRFIVRDDAEIRDGVLYLTYKDPDRPDRALVKRVDFNATLQTELSVGPCESKEEFDSKNPGVSAVVETSQLSAGGKASYTTRFSPAVDVE